jgi:hypothetical protein
MKKIWKYLFVVKPETGETIPVGYFILFVILIIGGYYITKN